MLQQWAGLATRPFVFCHRKNIRRKLKLTNFPRMSKITPTQPNRRRELEGLPTRPPARIKRRPDSPSTQSRGERNLPPDQMNRSGCLGSFFHSPMVIAILVVMLALFLVTAASAAVGWSFGSAEYNATATLEAGLYMLDQYNLALADVQAGNLSLARQRFEYIFAQDSNFLDVHEQLLLVLISLGSSTEAISSGGLPTETATPTQDPRPKEQLFAAAQALLSTRDWTGTIDTLLSLRKTDPNFHTADVDDMLYVALRNRGAQNILELGLFEPGLYDFSLAEAFGPLDVQALQYREWARLYLWGNAFWFAYPDQAAYYYGQLTGLAPNLTDASGMSAFSRYWHSLIHWAEQLGADEDWCGAYDQYLVALATRNDAELQSAANHAQEMCIGPTETPSITPSFTSPPLFTSTPTFTGAPLTNTPGQTETPTNTTEPPTETTEPPSDTPTPEPLIDTETPTETTTP